MVVGPTVRAACLASPAFTPLWPRRTAAPAAPFLPADMRAAQPISSTLYPSHPRQSGAGWLWLVVFLKETCGRDPRRGDAGGTGRLGAQTGRQSAVAWRHNNGSSVTPQQRQERCAVQLGAGRGRTLQQTASAYPLPEVARLDRSGAAPHCSQSAVDQAGPHK